MNEMYKDLNTKCLKYKNITKKQIKEINLIKSLNCIEKNKFLDYNIHSYILFPCYRNNNYLIIKFVYSKYIFDKNNIITNCSHGYNILHYCAYFQFMLTNIKILKFMINKYRINRTEILLKDKFGRNIIQICDKTNALSHKIIIYLVKKYNFKFNELNKYVNNSVRLKILFLNKYIKHNNYNKIFPLISNKRIANILGKRLVA